MAWDADKGKVGQNWIYYVEILPRTCSLVYGDSPCIASGGQCAYSWATCEDVANFDLNTTTYKFSSKFGGKVFEGTQIQPSLTSISSIPTEINPNKSITINARLVLTFEDVEDPPPFHSEKGSGKFYPYRKGTFWRIFTRIYRESYKYCTLKLYEGLPSYTSLNDFSLRRELKINNIEFSKGGKVRVTATDKTRLTKALKIPNAISSSNVLTQEATAGDAVIFVANTNEFKILDGGYPSYGKIIDSVAGDEYFEFTSIGITGTYLAGVTRGLFGTSNVTHAVGKKVIQVASFANEFDTGISSDVGKNPVDIAKEIILGWVGIDSGDVDDTEFDDERDLWYPSLKYRRIIESPVQADKLISQLNQFMMSNIWQNEDQKLTFRALQPTAPGETLVEFKTDENIINDTLTINNKVETQVSRVTVHFSPDDVWGLKDHSSADDFSEHLILINAAAETSNGQGEPIEVEFFADWIYNISEAKSFADRYMRRYSPVAPMEIMYQVSRRDSDTQTGDIVDITSEYFVNDDGTEDTLNFQVLSKSESQKGIIEMKALETKFDKKYAFITPSGYPDWTAATDAEKEYGYICDEDSDGEVFMSDGSEASYIW
ncbi:MAG: hypothetical protein ACTSO3_01195 [Candidatus Heimdallarchaeaceae archaeon]